MFDLQPPRHISTLRSPPDVGWRREQTQLTCSSVKRMARMQLARLMQRDRRLVGERDDRPFSATFHSPQHSRSRWSRFDATGLLPRGRNSSQPLAAYFAALGDWSSSLSALAWRSEILLLDRPERSLRFCRDCAENTAHVESDELGSGWYAQICRCRQCGRENMTVWPIAWW